MTFAKRQHFLLKIKTQFSLQKKGGGVWKIYTIWKETRVSILIKNEISKNILMTWENLMQYKVKIAKEMFISNGFKHYKNKNTHPYLNTQVCSCIYPCVHTQKKNLEWNTWNINRIFIYDNIYFIICIYYMF